MKSRMERAIAKLGTEIAVEGADCLKRGKGLLYPLRYRVKEWGGVEHRVQGRTEPGRYLLFCDRELVREAGYGSMVFEGNNRYAVIWKDEFSCSMGGYARVCVRRMKGCKA